MKLRALATIVLALAAAGLAWAQAAPRVNARALLAERPARLLSEYGLFKDAGAREPNDRVTPYALNTELYADGAIKFRFVFLPEGAAAPYSETSVLDLPIGAALIKTFAIPTDNGGLRYLETRLLVHRPDGWVAYPYIWNEEQTEAAYSPLGAEIPVNWTEEGAPVSHVWRVPNRNQCKGCHDSAGAITPIGPSVRNLNRDYPYADGAENQIARWTEIGILSGAPDPSSAPRAPNAYDPTDGPLDLRARAYLDVNCAHCHNPNGPASTSGLDLRLSNHAAYAWGVLKPPVAAGRGSAGMAHSIEPGHPEQSILLYRMNSTDPGVMMPELGRQRIDTQAVALIREWIAAMDRPAAQ